MRRLIWPALGAVSIAFHLWLVFSGLVPNLVSRPLHMALALPWMLIFVAAPGWQRRSGMVLAAIGVGICLWIAWNAGPMNGEIIRRTALILGVDPDFGAEGADLLASY